MSIQKALCECSIRWPLSAPNRITEGLLAGCDRLPSIRSRAEREDAALCEGKFLRGRSGTQPYLRYTTGPQTYVGGNPGHRVQAPGSPEKRRSQISAGRLSSDANPALETAQTGA